MKVVEFKRGEKIVVGTTEIVIVRVGKSKLELGIKAPREVPISIRKDDGPPPAAPIGSR